MIYKPHIRLSSALARLALCLLMPAMVLLCALRVAGQSTLPDNVCVGDTKHYWVVETVGSTYEWQIDGVVQLSVIHEIDITWNTVGDFTLTVQETSADNCPGEVKSLPVHVKNDPPTFTPPALGTGYCVQDISVAVYNPGGIYYVNDLVPPRPDYYLVPQGSTMLDYTLTLNSCPNTLTITWEIDFAGALPPNLTGTGQISASIPPGGMQFPPGNNVITWTVTDVVGNVTTYQVTLVVLPRPDIGDIPP